MIRSIDLNSEEGIRRWPVWFARLANRIIGWSDDYCTGGCGYPITWRLYYEVERFGGNRVLWGLCSLGGECERIASSDPRDSQGTSYADMRPDFIAAFEEEGLQFGVARVAHYR